MFVIISSIVTICSLAAVFAMHACGQLNVMHTWLNEFTEEKKTHLAEQRLAAIVKHHCRILSFVQQIESIMNKACLAELMGCTMNMCLFGYYVIMNWSVLDRAKILSHFMGYITASTNIFIYCYIGEILTEEVIS
ncbi:uncharacterized protein LOC112457908 [Temnothorax curvispinosus]|uniref:Uncharacterized protein LOC112457908 n=1 Tax=Temnothorax curvispinosus TaxID=300111 RepID=A0A6J1Q5N8_9HYME|nr:uncharacterized protein LOC112457908 [Temnothorax curvispinosus]